MTRKILGLAALAALAFPVASANAAYELPVRTYSVWCGYTVYYQCGMCVEVGTYTNCTYW